VNLDFVVADPSRPEWRSPVSSALPDGIRDVSAEATDELGPAAGVAGFELEGPQAAQLLARLTALDLDSLPAMGAVAEVRMLVERSAAQRFRIWVGQELAGYVAEALVDTAEGLGWD
jgi:hypothetical protein